MPSKHGANPYARSKDLEDVHDCKLIHPGIIVNQLSTPCPFPFVAVLGTGVLLHIRP